MDEFSDEEENIGTKIDSAEPSKKSKDKMIRNEMRSFRNRGYHDGYDEGKKGVIQKAFDAGYQKAFEQNFILSTLKGVAIALRSSQTQGKMSNSPSKKPSNRNRPTSTTSTSSNASTSTTCSMTSDPILSTSIPKNLNSSSRCNLDQTQQTIDASECSSVSSSRSNISNLILGSNSHKFSISSNHLSLLESMKFDDANNIESIKDDLIKICRENRLEILAHYVSQIG